MKIDGKKNRIAEDWEEAIDKYFGDRYKSLANRDLIFMWIPNPYKITKVIEKMMVQDLPQPDFAFYIPDKEKP